MGTITSAEIIHPGTNYTIKNNVCCISSNHVDCTSINTPKINITEVGTNGEIVNFNIFTGGINYKVNDTIIVTNNLNNSNSNSSDNAVLKVLSVSDK